MPKSIHSSPLLIDCNYVFPEFAAAYLIREGDRGIFVENNTAHAVPRLLEALSESNLTPDQVEYIIITHVHLDHAGGTYALMKACPNAKLLLHSKAAPHMVDPTALMEGACQVYGKKAFEALYPDIKPINPHRIRVMLDEEELQFGSRTLRFLYTRGHANHHFCVLDAGDSGSGGIFTGDAFGVAYPRLQKNGLFIFPSTSPTGFDPVEAKKSVQKILTSGATQAYLTHFGVVEDLESAARQLTQHLDFSESLLNEAIQSSNPDPTLAKFCETRLRSYFEEWLSKLKLPQDSRTWELLRMDIELNAEGIAHLAKKRRAGPQLPRK